MHHPGDVDATVAMVLTSLGLDRLPAYSGRVGARLSRLCADHDSRHRHGHVPDPLIRRVSDSIYGTIWVLLIAYVTRFIPYGSAGLRVRFFKSTANWNRRPPFGASWWETFKRVTLPLFRPGLVAGWVYICIVSFREFSTSVLLATGESRVLSILSSPCSSKAK